MTNYIHNNILSESIHSILIYLYIFIHGRKLIIQFVRPCVCLLSSQCTCTDAINNQKIKSEANFQNMKIWIGIMNKDDKIRISLVNLLQIALPITGQWVTDYESINPISGRGWFFTVISGV